MTMLRPPEKQVIVLRNSEPASTEITLTAGRAAGKIYFPANMTSSTVTVWSWNPATNTFVVDKDDAGNDVQITVTSSCAKPLPEIVFASMKIKLVTDADDSSKTIGLTFRA